MIPIDFHIFQRSWNQGCAAQTPPVGSWHWGEVFGHSLSGLTIWTGAHGIKRLQLDLLRHSLSFDWLTACDTTTSGFLHCCLVIDLLLALTYSARCSQLPLCNSWCSARPLQVSHITWTTGVPAPKQPGSLPSVLESHPFLHQPGYRDIGHWQRCKFLTILTFNLGIFHWFCAGHTAALECGFGGELPTIFWLAHLVVEWFLCYITLQQHRSSSPWWPTTCSPIH